MFGSYRKTAEGLQDALPGEVRMKHQVCAKVRETFALSGFAEVQTPLLEYLDVFVQRGAGLDVRQMWKTTDRAGNLLVVRPESTTPTLRLAAAHLSSAPLPLRLSYIQDRLEMTEGTSPQSAQATQAGVELLGESSLLADAEIVALAIQTLHTVGLENFLIDLGQVDFFRGLMEEAGLNPAQEGQLRALVEAKNMLGIEIFLRDTDVNDEVRGHILRLPSLYGGEEVIEKARGLTRSPRAHQALDRLHEVLRILEELDLKQHVSVDLGMLQEIHYYSGLIFRGLTSDLGKPLISGGRYDDMPADFGRTMPAIGFALDIQSLLTALGRQGTDMPLPRSEVLLGFAPGARRAALQWVAQQRAQGRSVECVYGVDAERVKALAGEKGAAGAAYIDEEGVHAL